MTEHIKAHVFQLDTPHLQQTHARIMDEYKNPSQGHVTVVLEFGTVDGEGQFIHEPGVTNLPVALSGVELSLFLDEPEKKGGKRGNYWDEDLGAWLKVGKSARKALVEAEQARLAALEAPPEEVPEEE